MKSEEVMKKLVDNYGTLAMVSRRRPSSMSRLKNLLMSEGVSETSARRKIADLDTEDGCLVKEEYSCLKLNQKLLSQMFQQVQSELNVPNYLAEEQKQQMEAMERKVEKLEKEKADEVNELKSKIDRKENIITKLKEEAEKEQNSLRWSVDFYRKRENEKAVKLEAAEEKIARMKKGVFSYLKVCQEDRRAARLEKKRIKREAIARVKDYERREREWEKARQEEEKKKRAQEKAKKKSGKKKDYAPVNKWQEGQE